MKSQCISSTSDFFPLCSNTFTTCSISNKPLVPLFRRCPFPLNWWTVELYCQLLEMQFSEVMSIRSATLFVTASLSDFSILAMVPDGPAALQDAILQMAFVIDSLLFSTWIFSDWSSRSQGNPTGDFHNALLLLSSLATVGYS